jgi:hypothetical protein
VNQRFFGLRAAGRSACNAEAARRESARCASRRTRVFGADDEWCDDIRARNQVSLSRTLAPGDAPTLDGIDARSAAVGVPADRIKSPPPPEPGDGRLADVEAGDDGLHHQVVATTTSSKRSQNLQIIRQAAGRVSRGRAVEVPDQDVRDAGRWPSNSKFHCATWPSVVWTPAGECRWPAAACRSAFPW